MREEIRRTRYKKKPYPSAAILDSQSVKSLEGGLARGFDAEKKVPGRKRHALVDMLGLLIKVSVTAGNVQDRDGAKLLLKAIGKEKRKVQRLKVIWRGTLTDWVEENFEWRLEIVHKPKEQHEFRLLPKRWVMERTFGWLVRQRRLARDYERIPETSEAFIYIAMIRLMIRNLAVP